MANRKSSIGVTGALGIVHDKRRRPLSPARERVEPLRMFDLAGVFSKSIGKSGTARPPPPCVLRSERVRASCKVGASCEVGFARRRLGLDVGNDQLASP